MSLEYEGFPDVVSGIRYNIDCRFWDGRLN